VSIADEKVIKMILIIVSINAYEPNKSIPQDLIIKDEIYTFKACGKTLLKN
jgi:hypothetical protein